MPSSLTKQNEYLAHDLFCASILPILRVLSLAVCSLGITTAHAEPPSRELLIKHVEALLEGHGDHLRKWAVPIRYRIIGLPSNYHKMLVDDFSRISDAMGFSIIEADLEKSSNRAAVILIFTDDPKVTAQSPGIREYFKKPNETEEGFSERFAEGFINNISLRWVGIGSDGVGALIEVFSSQKMLSADSNVKIEERLAALAFTTVTFATLSEALPSIENPWAMDPGHPRVTLTPIDIAFLKALNSPDIPHKMPIHEAAQRIAEKMIPQLN
jgi:hypothetical protein